MKRVYLNTGACWVLLLLLLWKKVWQHFGMGEIKKYRCCDITGLDRTKQSSLYTATGPEIKRVVTQAEKTG